MSGRTSFARRGVSMPLVRRWPGTRRTLPRALASTAIVVLLALGIGALPAAGQYYPPGFSDELVVAGLTIPSCFVFTPDGHILIGQQGGAIRVFEGGQLQPVPVLTLAVEPFSEQGLLGMALAPGFPDPPYLYVFYTPYTGNQTGNFNRVSRFTLSGHTVVPGSEYVVLGAIPAGAGFHVGGCLRFGIDGTLFISTGDTGWLTPYSQMRSRLEGKLLRVNADGTIPPDNPFVGVPDVRPEVYQWGLRNPFRFAIQPLTGTPFIGDVGYNAWEEVDAGPPGANFGWRVFEGSANPPNPAYVDPLFAYDHGLGSAAIVGTAFYQGNNFPAEYVGNLFFFDHPRGHLGRLVLGPANEVVSVTMPFIRTAAVGNTFGPVDLQTGPDGALYYCTYSPGTIRRIYYTGPGNRNPTAIATATPAAGYAPLPVTFDGTDSYDIDGDALTYAWDFGDGSPAASGPTALHEYTSMGTWNATLTVTDGRGGSNTSPPVSIIIGNLPPIVSITQPADSSFFLLDQTIAFGGSAVDPEEGAVADTSLHWIVMLHHLTHIHPVIQDLVGAGGTFVAGSHGENLSDISYEVIAWAEDSMGLRSEAHALVLPDPAQPQPLVRTYVIPDDDRDATSRLDEVLLSGYSVSEPFNRVSNDAELMASAVQFQLDVPWGASVVAATLTVRAGPAQSATASGAMLVRAYDVDSATPFAPGSVGPLTGHEPLTALGVDWPAPIAWVPADDAESPDLTALVQGFIDRPGYTPGAWLGLVISQGTLPEGCYFSWADQADGGIGSRLRVVYWLDVVTAAPTVPPPAQWQGRISLLPNVPNPFNPITSVPFQLAGPGQIGLTVLDLRGRRVRTLLTASLPAGRHSATWNGQDESGRPVASGIYLVRLEGMGNAATRTMTLVR